jgi:hypothetical protein
MNRSYLRAPILASLFLAACSGPGTDPGEPTGSIQVALTSAPADAACLKLSVTGSRSVNRSVDLTPGASTVLTIDKLPIGVVQMDGSAYTQSCAKVGSNGPTFVSEAPVSVRIDPAAVAKVVLELVRNGKLEVSVDFELPPWVSDSRAPIDLAVFGDTPYGATQIADVPNFLASLNNDPTILASVHLGDIKNGSSRCDDSYFQFVFDSFNSLKKPFFYTPGDNEWTDCHRANNGAYNPIERLKTIRTLFYPVVGQSLGVTKAQALSQATIPGFETFVENQLLVAAGAVFTMVHVVGSNNSLLPWYTDDTTGTKVDDPAARTAEYTARNAANLDWLDRSFAAAKLYNSATVVIIMQADMWDGTPVNGFHDTVQKIATLSAAFARPVLLIEGDSHVFKTDLPLANGSPIHGVTTAAPNLTRIVVQGSTTATLSEWVKLHIDAAASPPWSWTRVTH